MRRFAMMLKSYVSRYYRLKFRTYSRSAWVRKQRSLGIDGRMKNPTNPTPIVMMPSFGSARNIEFVAVATEPAHDNEKSCPSWLSLRTV